jgi:hypothetical protein
MWYRTTVSKRDHNALQNEADEIWTSVRQEVEATICRRAELRPVNYGTYLEFVGLHPVIVKNVEAQVFILERLPDGTWRKHGWWTQ